MKWDDVICTISLEWSKNSKTHCIMWRVGIVVCVMRAYQKQARGMVEDEVKLAFTNVQ